MVTEQPKTPWGDGSYNPKSMLRFENLVAGSRNWYHIFKTNLQSGAAKPRFPGLSLWVSTGRRISVCMVEILPR